MKLTLPLLSLTFLGFHFHLAYVKVADVWHHTTGASSTSGVERVLITFLHFRIYNNN